MAFIAVAVSIFAWLKVQALSEKRTESVEFPELPEFPTHPTVEPSASEEDEIFKKIYDERVEIPSESLSDNWTNLNSDDDDDIVENDADATPVKVGVPLVDITQVEWREDLIKLVGKELISQHRILPLFKRGNHLTVAAVNSVNPVIIDAICQQTQMTVEVVFAEVEALDNALKQVLNSAIETSESSEAFLVEDEGDTFGELECIILEDFEGSIDESCCVQTTDYQEYQHFDDSLIKSVREYPVSTFSIDVNTGSYANVRRILKSGHLPQKAAVRVEEMINYFDYDYPVPATSATPFQVTTEIAPAPWNPHLYILQIGIKGYNIAKNQCPPSNLVFLLDVSGSMSCENRLDSLKTALLLLTQQLTEKDSIAIISYADTTTLVLESTSGDQKAKIQTAIKSLVASGSTNGGAGIQSAYSMAQQSFIPNGINRILLGTDGDFNVGMVDIKALIELVERERHSGISLTTLGFGEVNYNDHLMKELAYAGGGSYAYIDTLNEAQKVLINQISSTLQVIAEDVKIQIEFNPSQVAEYRLIGYENRGLKREDFNNDKVHASNIGADHSVTALYELALTGNQGQRLEPLRYGNEPVASNVKHNDELAFLQLRYKMPNNETSQVLEYPVYKSMIVTPGQASEQFRFATAVAAFGQRLRNSAYIGEFSYTDILRLAQSARGDDEFGYRGEFIQLINLAKTLTT